MDKFEPRTVRYNVPDGRELVLRVDYHKGFKAHWIENPQDKVLSGPFFYNPVSVSAILADAEAQHASC